MKSLLLVVFILASLTFLSAQEAPFKVERMITDYHGVTTNGKNILCYGDYGIITYTLDFGKTFKQLSIGDRYSIKGIAAIGSDFVGFTETALLKSSDNGMTWQIKELPDVQRIIDMTVVNSTLYLLTPKGVFEADRNLNLSSIPLLTLDSTAEYSEIATDGKDMYIIHNKRNLIHYTMETKQFETTDVLKLVVPSCANCTNIADVKLSGTTVYVLINSVYSGAGIDSAQQIIKSDTKGKTWKPLTWRILQRGCYKATKNELEYIAPSGLNVINTSYIRTEYIRIDTSIYVNTPADYTVVNASDSIERTITYSGSDPTIYQEIININADTLIAVGNKKLISMSYNGGKNWEMKSYFNGNFLGYEHTSILSKDVVYITGYTTVYRTLDGGVTWLPQRFVHYPQFKGIPATSYHFAPTGKGYVKTITRDIADTNILHTEDFGENYSLYYSDSSTHVNFENKPGDSQFKQGKELRDYIVFLERHSDYYVLSRHDKNYRLIDTARIMATYIYNYIVTNDGKIICLCYQSSGTNKADSAGNTKDYKYKYYLLQSADQGKTWDSIKVHVPIYRPLHTLDNVNFMFLNDIYDAQQVGNYILYPTNSPTNTKSGFNVLYRYDLVNNLFDSIKIETGFSKITNTMFNFDSKVFAVTNTNNFIYTNAKTLGQQQWDTLPGTRLFSTWDGYNASVPQDDQDAIISTRTFDDTTGILLTGKSFRGLVGINFKVNLVKLVRNSTANSVEEPKIEVGKTMLWNFAPYPMPGNTSIRSEIYWNRNYNINDATINVYDMYGTSLQSKDIVIHKVLDYKGILEWDCSSAASGVYVIQITLAGESHSFPVMVWK